MAGIHLQGTSGDDALAGALYSKVSLYGAVFLYLNIILLTCLHAYDVQAYGNLTAEDSWVENGTAFLFFLTALLLLETAASRRPAWPYILGALAFVFAAGEEISWGQRIFLFETPDYLRERSRQDEFNLHNIEGLQGLFYRGCRTSIQLFCIAIGAAYCSRKSSFLGVPFPSILTMFCFLVVYAYRPRDLIEYFPMTIVSSHHMLLLFFVAYALFSRKIRLFVLSVVSLSAVVLEQFILHEFAIQRVSESALRPVWETQEYLFSIACFVYAAEILARRRPLGRQAGVLGRPGRFTLLLAVALATLGSCLVYAVNHITAARNLSSATSGVLAARGVFDIYLGEGSLSFVKEPCARTDTEATFFVHWYPVDPNDLPSHRKQYGFDGFNFDFRNHRLRTNGEVCVARRELPAPDYAIATIHTGQFTGEDQIWKVSFERQGQETPLGGP